MGARHGARSCVRGRRQPLSSKSEIALHLSLSGKYLTFMGYASPADALNISKSNTPGAVDPTNPAGENVYRAVDPAKQQWKLAYTLRNGLYLGTPYTVAGYPTGTNAGNGDLPWEPATDGLRNLIGYAYDDVALVYAITSTVSGSGDQGADPNKLMAVLDVISNTDPAFADYEFFLPVREAGFAEVLRGVALTPGTPVAGSQ